MKKTITLLVAWVLLATRLLATDFLAEDKGYLLDFFQQSGTPSDVYLNCQQDIITAKTTQNMEFTFGGNLTWYNLRARFLNCWYIFTFGKFDIQYELYYKAPGTAQFKLATEGVIYYIDEEMQAHEAQEKSYARTIACMDKKPFEHTFRWSLPQGSKNGTYEFKIALRVRPNDALPSNEYSIGKHFENGSTNIFCPYESAMKYITNDGGIVHYIESSTNQSGGKAVVNYVTTQKSILRSDADGNPKNSEGYRLVYDHPNAEFTVQLSTENAPSDTIIDGKRYYGYSHFICGIGENTQVPNYQEMYNEYYKCITKSEYIYCNTLQHFDFLHLSHPTLYQFLKQKYENKELLDGSSNLTITPKERGIFKFKHILLQTANESSTLFNENAISKLADYEQSEQTWFNRTYHVRDLEFCKLPKTTIGSGTVFKIWDKLHYTNNLYTSDLTLSVGCSYYGPATSHMQTYCSNNENYPYLYLGENCLMFKILPQVTFPTLSEAEKSIQYVCSNQGNAQIHLQGKNINCDNVSPTLYRPHYVWQMSDNLIAWKTIDENNPYLNTTYDADNYIPVDSKDLVLKSSIVKNGKPIYFRQLCVLKSFASDEESSLYNFPVTLNGKTKYYISVAATDYYTYKSMPELLEQNFTFHHYNWSENVFLCKNEGLSNRHISFGLAPGNNLNEQEIQYLENQVQYRVYRTNKNGEKTLVSRTNNYLLPEQADSLHLTCAILTCSDSIGQSFSVFQYPMETISWNKIASTAAISKRDSIRLCLRLSCLEGSSPTLTLNEDNLGSSFWIRRVMDKKQAERIDVDWSNINRNTIHQLFENYGWNFAADTGFDMDNATISQLRNYGEQKQWLQNAINEQQATDEFIANNRWELFDRNEEGSTTLAYRNDVSQPKFYIREENEHGCWSDSILVELSYVSPVVGNYIAFKNNASDTAFVVSGEGNPYIVGSYPVSGGYGPVSEVDGTSYTYQWMRKSSNNEWEPIVLSSRYAQVTDNGSKVMNSSTKYVSLPESTLKNIQENWEIARFVYSRQHDDEASQLVSISNSLWMLSTPMLDESYVQVYRGKCPNEKISLVVNEPEEYVSTQTRYCWKASDSNLVLSISSTLFGNSDNKCIIKEAEEDFSIILYRYDATTGVKSNTIEIPIAVEEFKNTFSIVYGNYEYDLDETLILSPGSKIQLKDQSADAEENHHVWVLQLQEDFMGDGRVVEGTTSNAIHPTCYLYNIGQNKIKLTTTSNAGCSQTLVAENIFVQGINDRAIDSFFADDNNPLVEGTFWTEIVAPTLLNAENNYTICIITNQINYRVGVYNLLGQAIVQPIVTTGNYWLSLSDVAAGTYLLYVNNTVYKLIKN